MNNSAGILRVETHFSKNNVPPVGVSQGKKISFADEHGDQLAHNNYVDHLHYSNSTIINDTPVSCCVVS